MQNEIEIINALNTMHEQCFSSSRVPKHKMFVIRPSRSCTANVFGIFGIPRQEVYSEYLNANGIDQDNNAINTIKRNPLIAGPLFVASHRIKTYQLMKKARHFGFGVSDYEAWNIFCEELTYRLNEISKMQDCPIIINELTMVFNYINAVLTSPHCIFPQDKGSSNSMVDMLSNVSKDVELTSGKLITIEQAKVQSMMLSDITTLGKAIISESFSVLTILCSNKSQQDSTIFSCIDSLRKAPPLDNNLEQLLSAILDTPLFKILFPSNQLQTEGHPQTGDTKSAEFKKAFAAENPLIAFDTIEHDPENIFSVRKNNFKLHFGPQNIIVVYSEFARKTLIDLTERNSGIENYLANDHEFLKKVMTVIGFLYELTKVLMLNDSRIENSFIKNDSLKLLKLVDFASYLCEAITQTMNIIFHQCLELYNAAKLCKPYQTMDQHTKYTRINVSQEWQKNHLMVNGELKHLLDNLSVLRNKTELLKKVIINGMPVELVKQLNLGDKIVKVDGVNNNSLSCLNSQSSSDQPKSKDNNDSDKDIADVMRLNMMTNVRQDLTNRATSGRLDDRSRAEYVQLDQQIEQLETSIQRRYK